MNYPKILEELINHLMKFPGIGRRSAERIASYILDSPSQEVKSLVQSIVKAKERIRFCRLCNNLTENEICSICSDNFRDDSLLCIVEQPKDVIAIEKTGQFKGKYYVLLGAISPLEGKGPEHLKLKELLTRLKNKVIKEIIIATDSDTEGEATALYLTKIIKPSGIKIARIGLGIPVGTNLEYIDPSTLSKALEGRREI